MPNNRSDLFFAGANGSTVDPSLPNRRIPIPEGVSSYNWGSIVASNASHWSSQCPGVIFGFNSEGPAILAAGSNAQTTDGALDAAVTFVNNIFTNDKLMEQYASASPSAAGAASNIPAAPSPATSATTGTDATPPATPSTANAPSTAPTVGGGNPGGPKYHKNHHHHHHHSHGGMQQHVHGYHHAGYHHHGGRHHGGNTGGRYYYGGRGGQHGGVNHRHHHHSHDGGNRHHHHSHDGQHGGNRHHHHQQHQQNNPNHTIESYQIPDDRVGLVIGTKGATIKAIKDVSGAHIQIEKQSDGSGVRGMTIAGTPEQIERAKTEIDRVVKNQSLEATTEDQKLSEMITIPSNVVGTVIGRQGETIRLLQMLTHCTILMQKDNDVQVGATSRNVQLLGTDQQIEAAKVQIQKLVDAQNKATLESPVDANFILTGRASHRTMDIRVNNDIIGLVIGKGGENIRRVNEKSGAKINVDKATQNPIRIISIVAHNENSLRQAESLLRDIIAECNHKKNKPAGFPQHHQHLFGNQPSNMLPSHYPVFPANTQAGGYPQPIMYLPQQYPQGLPPGAPMMQPHMVQRGGMSQQAGGAVPSMAPIPTGAPNTSGSPSVSGGAPVGQPSGVGGAAGLPSSSARTAEEQSLYEYYYTFYLKSFPADKAAEFAEYYMKNPPTK